MSNLILPKSRFIHIPKCGGSTVAEILHNLNLVEEVIRQPYFGHLFLSQMPPSSLYTFTFVRHPVTWWQSFYNHNKNCPVLKSQFMKIERETKDFNFWLKNYGQIWLGQYSMKLKRYLGEDSNFPTTNKINFIGKVENLIPDLKYALGAAGEIFNDEEVSDDFNCNVGHYDRKDISQESMELIYSCEREVYIRFGYNVVPD